ncbi:LANO_0E07756g1_1 [Lachancea nothofagi CBS 11611]|uniref:Nuclear protein localization protein 4 n=1 Tax=Lachancea nothofagi CBS 11611 TaxID=1266666 RepID=A0A1G4JUV7_9SACH|nr:LANO_0E07756g1_1 [Lachancea nothofagi CBS 11611]
MILRFKSRDGMHRVECVEAEKFGQILEKLLPRLSPNVDVNTLKIGLQPTEMVAARSVHDKSVAELGFKHGTLVTVTYEVKEQEQAPLGDKTDLPQATVKITPVKVAGPLEVEELPVDDLLEKLDGLIPRKRSYLCKHGDRGMCEYCSPLPPWDREHQKEKNIKHISFHSHLKQLSEQTNKKSSGGSYIPPLSQPDFRINKNCSGGHEPWPRGICSKCQPSAITLKQQDFRMVDHVEFQKSELINSFIDSWRNTGTQRFGYIYGNYAAYDATPLGIIAKAEAIYEPPQHDEQDGLTMDVEMVRKEMQNVDELAKQMGLIRIGMIFTDLTDAGNGDGSVFCKRHKDSFFLSSLEVIMAADHQLKHPNVSRFSEQGVFSSKFVTCVVSGNVKGEIDISTYQVSTDAEALVQADMITASTHPSMSYINETNKDRYVPELFYMRTNEYGLLVKENAKPAFPVDYLLVSLTHGFPTEEAPSRPMFASATGFPWTNRQILGQSQDYMQLKKYLFEAATSGDFELLQKKLSNFHLLLYINSLQILSPKEWQLICSAIKTGDQSSLYQLVDSPEWQTLIMILQESV